MNGFSKNKKLIIIAAVVIVALVVALVVFTGSKGKNNNGIDDSWLYATSGSTGIIFHWSNMGYTKRNNTADKPWSIELYTN